MIRRLSSPGRHVDHILDILVLIYLCNSSRLGKYSARYTVGLASEYFFDRYHGLFSVPIFCVKNTFKADFWVRGRNWGWSIWCPTTFHWSSNCCRDTFTWSPTRSDPECKCPHLNRQGADFRYIGVTPITGTCPWLRSSYAST